MNKYYKKLNVIDDSLLLYVFYCESNYNELGEFSEEDKIFHESLLNELFKVNEPLILVVNGLFSTSKHFTPLLSKREGSIFRINYSPLVVLLIMEIIKKDFNFTIVRDDRGKTDSEIFSLIKTKPKKQPKTYYQWSAFTNEVLSYFGEMDEYLFYTTQVENKFFSDVFELVDS